MVRRVINLYPALLWVALTALPLAARAETGFVAQSGALKVALLELYTSQGCSSCPPADRFLSRLTQAGYAPERVVPLAFHVTYWDYLGWRDPYAHVAFDERQYESASRSNSRRVYTPQLLLNGRDLRSTGRFEKQLTAANAAAPAADLRVRGKHSGTSVDLDVSVQIDDPALRRDAALYVALVESGLGNRVDAGENRGRELQHDHVVRQLYGPLALSVSDADSRHALRVDLPAGVNRANAGLVLFVQNRRDGSLLQALAVSLPDRDSDG